MKNIIILFLLVICSGCAASGPKLSTIEPDFPPLDPDKARLFFYRTYNPLGAGMRQYILVDDKAVGRSIPGSVFYADVSEGNHEIKIKYKLSDAENSLKTHVKAGETRYFVTWVGGSGYAGRINIKEMPEAEARTVLGELSYLAK